MQVILNPSLLRGRGDTSSLAITTARSVMTLVYPPASMFEAGYRHEFIASFRIRIEFPPPAAYTVRNGELKKVTIEERDLRVDLFPGQKIIARVEHKSTPIHHLRWTLGDTEDTIENGTTIKPL